jgi:hypothetical protein
MALTNTNPALAQSLGPAIFNETASLLQNQPLLNMNQANINKVAEMMPSFLKAVEDMSPSVEKDGLVKNSNSFVDNLYMNVQNGGTLEASMPFIKSLASDSWVKAVSDGTVKPETMRKASLAIESLFQSDFADAIEVKFNNLKVTEWNPSSSSGMGVESVNTPASSRITASVSDGGDVMFSVNYRGRSSQRMFSESDKLNKDLGQPLTVLLKSMAHTSGLRYSEVWDRYFKPLIKQQPKVKGGFMEA